MFIIIMIRYWFEFDFNDYQDNIPFGVGYGCGITAYNYNQAISFLRNKIFENKNLPKISKLIENIDISKLDEGKVIPNMLCPISIGIWFPLGYE